MRLPYFTCVFTNLQGENKKTGEEKESEFGMNVEEAVSRNENGSKRKGYCGKSW